MFVLGNFIEALALVLSSVLTLYWWIMLIAVLLSWVNPDPRNPIVSFLRSATEPVLWQVRRWMPFVVVGNFDLSPLVVLLGIEVVRLVVVKSLYDIAFRMAGLPAELVRLAGV
jgi:YggT family protein